MINMNLASVLWTTKVTQLLQMAISINNFIPFLPCLEQHYSLSKCSTSPYAVNLQKTKRSCLWPMLKPGSPSDYNRGTTLWVTKFSPPHKLAPSLIKVALSTLSTIPTVAVIKCLVYHSVRIRQSKLIRRPPVFIPYWVIGLQSCRVEGVQYKQTHT